MTVNSRLPTQFILIMLPMVFIPLVLMPSTLSMIQVWEVNETFTHGFLILPISVWMLWHKIDDLRLLPIEPEPRVFFLIAPISLLWFIAKVVDVQVVQHFTLVLLIQTSIWLLLGRQVVTKHFFPLAYLIFMVPVGQGLIPVMMDFTANFTVNLIELSGIPVYQDGLYFILPSGNWSVVEECSGVRYLIASFALGTLYAYMTYESLRKRLIFIAFSIIVPIIANGLRAYGIVMIGHLSDMELATGVDHLIYGWVFFGIVIFAMFLVGSFWADERPAYDSQVETTLEKTTPLQKPLVLLTITLSLLLGLLLYTKAITEHLASSDHLAAISIEPPNAYGEWLLDESNDSDWRPVINNPTLSISRLYRSGADTAQLDIGYFPHQSNDAEAVSTQNSVVPYGSDNWKKLRASNIQIQDFNVAESEIQLTTQGKLLVWQWYQIGIHVTSSPYMAKILDAYNQIIHRRGDAAYITLATPLGENTESSRKILQTFWRVAFSDIRQQVGDAYSSQPGTK